MAIDEHLDNALWLAGLAVGLTVAITVVVWSWFQIRAWYWDGDDPAADAGAFLTALRESTREGEVSDKEYRSIQSRLASRIQGDVPTEVATTNETAVNPDCPQQSPPDEEARSAPDETQA